MYCDNCIHKEVCGKEGCGDPATTFCDDRITEAIPVEWVENYITLLITGSHSDHEPELEGENKKKALAIRGMLEYYKLDKRISNTEEIINKIKSVVLPNGNTVSADDLGIDLEVKVDESRMD